MFITPAGLPSLSQVLWVLLGGYLMAGGANAINMWFDRDIDDKMTPNPAAPDSRRPDRSAGRAGVRHRRSEWRPLPSSGTGSIR